MPRFLVPERDIDYLASLTIIAGNTTLPGDSRYTMQLNRSDKNVPANLYYAGIYILCFSIPFPYIVSSIALGLASLGWLCSIPRSVFADLRRRRLILLWLGFYLLYCLGYLVSNNKQEASFELVHKLGFVLLPLIAGTGPDFRERQWRNALLSFAGGLVAVACWAYVRAFIEYRSDGSLQHFFYHDLAGVTEANAVYLAWYALCSIFALILLPRSILQLDRRLQWLLLVFLEVFFLLLSSRLLIVLHILLLLPMVLLAAGNGARKPLLRLSLVFTVVIVAIAVTDNPVSQRYKIMLPPEDKVFLKDSPTVEDADQQFSNVTLRLFLWKTSLEAIRDNRLYWYGAGTGDVEYYQEQSIKKYYSRLNEGNRNAHLWKYNIHNMYIQVLYMLGIPGLLVLLCLLVLPVLVYGHPGFRYAFAAFTIVSGLFMCIEAALQTQAGIFFFPLFSVLYLRMHYNRSET